MAAPTPSLAWHQPSSGQVTPRDLEQVQVNVRAALAALPLPFVQVATPPLSSSSAGSPGQVYFDASGGYLYLCVATNTWRRCALGSF